MRVPCFSDNAPRWTGSVMVSLCCINVVCGQPTVAPTPVEPAGQAAGRTFGDYNIFATAETGYRFRTVDGSLGKYRSDVNFGNGIRLLNGQFRIHPLDGSGLLLDELLLSTQGLGNDPYQFSSLRIRKDGLYQYNLTFRLDEYFNPGLTIAQGLHRIETERRLQDHDLRVSPHGQVDILLGYTRNSQDGPALSTFSFAGTGGDVFPLFTDLRRLRTEFRLGTEVRARGLRLNLLRAWSEFEENAPQQLAGSGQGLDGFDDARLSRFRRIQPYTGSTPYWRVNLFAETGQWLSGNARFTHADGERSFVVDESLFGANRIATGIDQQIVVSGEARRPLTTANLTLNLFPRSRLTVANHFAFSQTRMEGDSVFRLFDNQTARFENIDVQFLGMRTFANTLEVSYAAHPAATVYGGYGYSGRRVRSVERFATAETSNTVRADQQNNMHTGFGGARFRLFRRVTASLDAELGRADRPFYPIANRDYHAFGGTVRYRHNGLVLFASARSIYNTNSISLATHGSQSRNYSVNGSWAPRGSLSFFGGYTKNHLYTVSALAYFARSELVVGERSLYFSNIHAVNGGARFAVWRGINAAVGYTRVQDTGDGRERPAASAPGSDLRAFQVAQVFPLTFETPYARISVPIRGVLRWNFGYQFYGYSEEFLAMRDYRAHTGYTSLSWSF